MRRRELVVGLSALASASLAGCSGGSDDESGSTETENGMDSTETETSGMVEQSDPDGELIGNDGAMVITEYSSEVRYHEAENEMQESGDRYFVDGVLENTSDESKGARINVEYFDADGNSLNSGIFIQEFGIEAGATWEFESYYTGAPDEVDSYALEPMEF